MVKGGSSGKKRKFHGYRYQQPSRKKGDSRRGNSSDIPTYESLTSAFQVVEVGSKADETKARAVKAEPKVNEAEAQCALDRSKARRASIEFDMERYLCGGLRLPDKMVEGSDSLGRPKVRVQLSSASYTYYLSDLYGDLKAVRSREDLYAFYEKYPDSAAVKCIPLIADELEVLNKLYPFAA